MNKSKNLLSKIHPSLIGAVESLSLKSSVDFVLILEDKKDRCEKVRIKELTKGKPGAPKKGLSAQAKEVAEAHPNRYSYEKGVFSLPKATKSSTDD